MSEIWFTANHRFGPDRREREPRAGRPELLWSRYLAWSGLRQLEEVVGLDAILCEPVVPPYSEDLTTEDWEHVVARDGHLRFYRDLDHVLGRSEIGPDHQVLAVLEEPPEDAAPAFDDARFSFVGYELLDRHGDVSALTNCGGFPRAFAGAELNRFGLLDAAGRAYRVRSALRREYAAEHHADCGVWAVWRMRLSP